MRKRKKTRKRKRRKRKKKMMKRVMNLSRSLSAMDETITLFLVRKFYVKNARATNIRKKKIKEIVKEKS